MNVAIMPSMDSGSQRWLVAWAIATSVTLCAGDRCFATAPEAELANNDCDVVRKADIMHGSQWQRAVAELGGWLATQTVYTPAEVRRIKVRFNEQVAAMYMTRGLWRKRPLISDSGRNVILRGYSAT